MHCDFQMQIYQYIFLSAPTADVYTNMASSVTVRRAE